MKSSVQSEIIDSKEWDFDNVPNGELKACCYWEYARESAFIQDTIRKFREWHLSHGKWGQAAAEVDRNFRRIQSLGQASNIFLGGSAFKPGRVCQSADPDKPDYRHPEAPPLSGDFPAPWLSLPLAERQYRSRLENDVRKLGIVPIKLSHWSWGRDIARLREKQASALPESEPTRPGLRWGFGETLLVDIAWDAFTNDEIATYFRQWLKTNRPEDCPAPNRQGRKPGDWRAQLTRLAVMRLLSRYSVTELFDHNGFPQAWETKQFKGLKWLDTAKWRDARREARKTFHRLFPFLPKGENPLSWERRAPGN